MKIILLKEIQNTKIKRIFKCQKTINRLYINSLNIKTIIKRNRILLMLMKKKIRKIKIIEISTIIMNIYRKQEEKAKKGFNVFLLDSITRIILFKKISSKNNNNLMVS